MTISSPNYRKHSTALFLLDVFSKILAQEDSHLKRLDISLWLFDRLLDDIELVISILQLKSAQ
jgi:hypothetical protein